MVARLQAGEPQGPIRVLVGDMSGVLGGLVSRLVEQQPDMVLAGTVRDRLGLLAAAQAGVDVVILDAPRACPPPGICTHLLSICPDLRILVLSTSGDAAAVYWLGLRRRQLRSVSAETLTGAIRRACALNPAV